MLAHALNVPVKLCLVSRVTSGRIKEALIHMKRKLNFRTAVCAAFTAVALLGLTIGAGAVQVAKPAKPDAP
jgi:hypothetical protein